MTHTINDDLQINGDVYLKQNNYVSLHYGNRGRLGETPSFNPDQDRNGLWLEASQDGSESGGIFCNGNTIVLWSPGDNDTLRVYDEDDFDSPNLEPKFVINDIGNVGIGTASPQAKLHVKGDIIAAGDIRIDRSWLPDPMFEGVTYTTRATIQCPQAENSSISFHSPGGPKTALVTDGPIMSLESGAFFNGNVIVTGDVVLRNADCAEEFPVEQLETIEPGTVMVLSKEGSLRQSTEAYDKKVAGVVSGAGDLKPGLILDQQPESTNRMPIALMGKVYCKVNADYAAIEVGDLLTTSPTPGHAMKATDPLKAFGTVIGKALKPLNKGTGLIPILISLQ
jgi:hypothetical protein